MKCTVDDKTWDNWKYPVMGFGGGLFFIGSTLVLYNIMTRPPPPIPTNIVLCESSACSVFGRLLRSSVNNSLDACQDFYQFVCDGWDSTHALSVMAEHRTKFLATLAKRAREAKIPTKKQSLLQKAAAFFQICEAIALRRRDEMSAFRTLLKRGALSWPEQGAKMLLPSWAYATKFMGVSPLLVLRRSNVTSKSATISIHPSPLVEAWANARKEMNAREGYLAVLSRASELIFGKVSETKTLQFFKTIDDQVIDSLAHLYRARPYVLLSDGQFRNMSAAIQYPAWRQLFSDVLDISKESSIALMIRKPEFFRNFVFLTGKLGESSMVLYVTWSVIYNAGRYFSADLADLFLGAKTDTTASTDVRCLVLVEHLLGLAISASFAHQALTWEIREDIRRLTKSIDHLLESYLANFTGNTSRYADFHKFKSRTKLYGDLGDFRNVSDILVFAKSFPDLSGSFAEDYVNALSLKRKVELESGACHSPRLSKKNYYRFFDRDCKEVVVSPLASTPPVYDEQTTAGLRYGTMGSLISLALFEEFYDSIDEYPDDQRESLRYARDCMGRTIFKVDTVSNVEEAFLLHAAHKFLWGAFRSEVLQMDRRLYGFDNFTEQQVFFISLCFIRCSGRGRHRESICNAPLKNSPYFSSVFSCPTGSPMNLGIRCKIF